MPRGVLETFADGDPLVVTITTGGVEVELDNERLGPVAIRRGRKSADARPEAAVVSFTCYADALTGGLPELGDPLVVELSAALLDAIGGGPAHARRFTGTVSDVASRPSSNVVTIVGVGPRGGAARIPVGEAPWPQETDGDRAERILDVLAAQGFDVLPGDPGVVDVLARDVDSQPAASLLDELAAHTGGDAWETRAGELVWRDARSRTDLAPALVLDASNVLVDPEFRKDLDGLVTDLEVAYGVPVFDPVDGSTTQATVRVVDTAAPIQALAARVATKLAAEGDAMAYALDVVGRRSRPRFKVPDLTVDALRTLSLDQLRALLAAEPGVLIGLTGMPTNAGLTSSQVWGEGWIETYTRNVWRIALAVTPRGLTGAQARWIDVPETYTPGEGETPLPMTWAAPSFAGLSWLGTAGWWTDEFEGGRWADVPANLRWSNYPPATEWGDLT